MKTKFKHFGNSAIALVLSAIMLLSSSIVGSSSTVNTKTSEAVSESTAAVAEATSTGINTEEVKAEETASENGSVFVDNEEVKKTNSEETATIKLGNKNKNLPEVSGTSYNIYFFYPEKVYSGGNAQTFNWLKIWSWNNSTGVHNTNTGEEWPGTAVTSTNSDGLYVINLDSSDDRIIFNICNNGNLVKQSSDITIDTSNGNIFSFYGNTGLTYGVTNTLYYKSSSGTPTAYSFTDRTGEGDDRVKTVYTNATFPGVTMDSVTDDIYSVEVPSYYESIIFKNDNGQTADLKIQYNANGTVSENYFDGTGWDVYGDGGIDIDDGNTYLLYSVNSYNTWTPRYAHFWNGSSDLTTWPGVKLKKVQGYNNLYALNVSSYSAATKVQFSDGTGTAEQTGERDYDYSAHQGEDMNFSYSSTTYNSSSSTKKVYVANQQKYNYTDKNYNVHYVRRFDVKDFSELTGNDTSEPSLGSNIRVYAKSGTVRDQGSSSTAQYNKYSELADTMIYADGTTASNDSNGYHGFSYYKNDWWSYSVNGGGNRVTLAHAAKGTKINITTTIKSSFRSKYYVKAFCINGESYNIIDESQADTTNGVYTCSYYVPSNVDAVEITPIYYYIEGYNSSDYITFSVEDFAGSVKTKWGNTIACYAWYENGNNGATADNEVNQQALGGYPGQPMLHEGGSYYMQLPKSTSELGNIKGITLNNYVWDDVHGYYLRTYTDFNGLNNTSDSSFNDVTNRKEANAQTYDYDDFAALKDLNDVSEIIFSFKYRTFNNHGAAYGDSYANDGNLPQAGNISASDAANKFGANANGWNVLVDYDDHPVDLFGNDLTNVYPKDKNVFNEDNTRKLFVVSDGYINYYTDSTYEENNSYVDRVSDDYLGEYATKWYVYTFDGNTYTYQGALPPSAFISDTTLAGYSTINSSNETAAKTHFAKYLDSTVHSAAVDALFGTYKTLFNKYKNWPVEITYESALNSNGRYGANDKNYGYRNDGRWYYSRSTSTITAETKIYIIDSNGTLNYDGITYTKDEYVSGKNVGTITGAKACFDNSELGLPHAGSTSLSDITKDPDDYFQLQADSVSTVTDGDKTYNYVFQGWYLDTGGDVLNPITENTKAYRKMNSFATFVAVYSKEEVADASTKVLLVNHGLYAEQNLSSTDPAAHDGTGMTYVESIVVTDSTGETTYATVTGNEVDSLHTAVGGLEALNTGTNKVTVTIRTVPESDAELTNIYQYDENGSSTKYASKDITSAVTSSTGTTVSYTYTVSELFGSGENEQSFVVLDLFSDLKLSNSSKDIPLEFNFYDRDVKNNTTATIKSTPTTLHYTLTDITDYTSLKNKLGSFVGTESDEGITFLGDLTNVLDEYYIWSTQTQAIDTLSGFGGHHYYKDDTVDEFGAQDEGVVMYSDLENYDAVKAYHTDYLGTPQTSGENWVTYYDSENNPIPVNGQVLADQGVFNDNVNPAEVSRIVVWAFNTPKKYTLTVCTDQKYALEFGEEETYHGTLISANQGIDDDELYFFGDENECATLGEYYGFYNQRVGAADTEGAEDNGSDRAVDYLINYFGRTGEGAVTTDIAYTGDVVEAPVEAKGPEYTDSNKETQTTYYFDGWYIKAHNGEYVKVSSDRVYGNRITTNLTIYSMYKKTNGYANGASSIGGTAATSNGKDIYIDDSKVKNVRLNTQLNVYYNGKHIDNDSNIKQVSVIYVNLNDSEVGDDAAIATAGAAARSWINTNSNFLTQATNPAKVRKSGKVELYTGDTDKHVVIMDTYQNTNPASGNLQITLTSKNRIQFVLPMTSELYNGTYSNLIAFVAIQYDDGTNPSEWLVSDNYVSYIPESVENVED